MPTYRMRFVSSMEYEKPSEHDFEAKNNKAAIRQFDEYRKHHKGDLAILEKVTVVEKVVRLKQVDG